MPLNDTKLIIEGGEGGVKKRLTTACNLTRTQCSSKWVQEQNAVRQLGLRARQNLVPVQQTPFKSIFDVLEFFAYSKFDQTLFSTDNHTLDITKN